MSNFDVSKLDEALTLIAAKAKALREAGVSKLELLGIALELLPDDPPASLPTPETRNDGEEAPVDPLDDPETFGGALPRRRDVEGHGVTDDVDRLSHQR